MPVIEATPAATSPVGKFRRVIGLAAWFGIVTGLVEGTGLLVFQKLGWLNWRLSWQFSVSAEIIWIAAVFDLLLFIAVGLFLAGLARLAPRLPIAQLAVFSFSFLSFFDWLALTGRIALLGTFWLAFGLAVILARWFRKHEPAVLNFWHKTLPWVVSAAAVALVSIEGGHWLGERLALARLPAAPTGSPNILVLVVDTLRADHLSAYGYPRLTSPNLERIGQRGILFENAFSGSSWTLPSHASLLTGREAHEHHADVSVASLDGRFPTIAEALRDRGYRTGAFSGNNYIFGRRQGFGRGFIHFEDYFNSAADMAVRTLFGRKFERTVLRHRPIADIPGRWRARDVTRSVLRWIARDTDKPFFVFVNYFDVHDPYLPPEPYRSRFSKVKSPGGILNTLLDRYYPKLTPEQLQEEVDAYDGGIAYVDENIGRLLEELNKRGLAESTLVVFTSDHGESFGEHGLLHHRGALYDELIHVPLIFYWPGHLPAGLRVPQPVSNTALPATLMALAGAGDQTVFPGPSLARLWKTPSDHPTWPYPLAELAQFPYEEVKRNPSYYGAMKSLVSPEWHYIWHEKFGPSLYDWRKDPGELNNLASTPEGQRVVSEFAMRLQTLLLRSQGTRPSPSTGGSAK